MSSPIPQVLPSLPFRSTLQCLSSLELLWAYMVSSTDVSGEGRLSVQFRENLYRMRAGGRVAPRKLFSEVARQAPRFKGFAQQDAQELLRYLLDAISEEEIKRLKQSAAPEEGPAAGSAAAEQAADREPSTSAQSRSNAGQHATYIHKVFGGRLASLVTCSTCLASSVTEDLIFDASLPIPAGAGGNKRAVPHRHAPSRASTSHSKPQAALPAHKSKGSKGTTACEDLRASLAKLLKDPTAALDIAQARTKAKATKGPLQEDVEPVTAQWLQKANKKQLAVWLMCFAPLDTVNKYKLMQDTLRRTLGMYMKADLQSIVKGAWADLQAKWKAKDAFAPHGETHAAVCAVADPAVEAAMRGCTVAVQVWSKRTQDLAGRVAEEALAAALQSGAKATATMQQAHEPDADSHKPQVEAPESEKVHMTPTGHVLVNGWEFPPAYAVGGRPPVRWPGVPALDYPGSKKGPQTGTLNACLAAFTQPELLLTSQGNGYRCGHCGDVAAAALEAEAREMEPSKASALLSKAADLREHGARRDAAKRMCFSELPFILTLHLKRFRQTGTGRFVKDSAAVAFPRHLKMGRFVAKRNPGDGDAPADPGPYLYELSGVVVHGGGLGGGHYVAYTRTADGWAYASDSSTSKSSESTVLNQQAYILFYVRVHPEAAAARAGAAAASGKAACPPSKGAAP